MTDWKPEDMKRPSSSLDGPLEIAYDETNHCLILTQRSEGSITQEIRVVGLNNVRKVLEAITFLMKAEEKKDDK